jgi:hypothetical protein
MGDYRKYALLFMGAELPLAKKTEGEFGIMFWKSPVLTIALLYLKFKFI